VLTMAALEPVTSTLVKASMGSYYAASKAINWQHTVNVNAGEKINFYTQEALLRIRAMIAADKNHNLSQFESWYQAAVDQVSQALKQANANDLQDQQEAIASIEKIRTGLNDFSFDFVDNITDPYFDTAKKAVELKANIDQMYNQAAAKVSMLGSKIEQQWLETKDYFQTAYEAFNDDNTKGLKTLAQQHDQKLREIQEQFEQHQELTSRELKEVTTNLQAYYKNIIKENVNMRLNAGIPADHNLSVYEACLLYGPRYDHIHEDLNFTAVNFEWFYQVFTPLSDFILSYGKQQFVGLEWGDNEDFMQTAAAGGGMLPRATEACNAEQLALVQQASDYEPHPGVLLTHFTFVNFPTASAISDKWTIDTRDVGMKIVNSNTPQPAQILKIGDRNQGEEGSFHKLRSELYNEHVLNGNFKYCMAGHSHRAALYESKNIEADTFTATGMLPEAYPPNSFGDKTPRIIVSGCGGPVAKQNHSGELAGWGMDTAQGCWIDIANDKVHPIRSTLETAKPRFAVALDYMEIESGEPLFVEMKTMDIESGVFEVVMNKEFKDPANIVDHVKLHYVDGDSLAYIGNITLAMEEGSNRLTNNKWSGIYKKTISRSKLSFYISAHLNKPSEKEPTYLKYNFNSPLCYPVDLVKRKGIFGGPDVWYISRVMAEPNAQAFKELTDQVDEYQQ